MRVLDGLIAPALQHIQPVRQEQPALRGEEEAVGRDVAGQPRRGLAPQGGPCARHQRGRARIPLPAVGMTARRDLPEPFGPRERGEGMVEQRPALPRVGVQMVLQVEASPPRIRLARAQGEGHRQPRQERGQEDVPPEGQENTGGQQGAGRAPRPDHPGIPRLAADRVHLLQRRARRPRHQPVGLAWRRGQRAQPVAGPLPVEVFPFGAHGDLHPARPIPAPDAQPREDAPTQPIWFSFRKRHVFRRFFLPLRVFRTVATVIRCEPRVSLLARTSCLVRPAPAGTGYSGGPPLRGFRAVSSNRQIVRSPEGGLRVDPASRLGSSGPVQTFARKLIRERVGVFPPLPPRRQARYNPSMTNTLFYGDNLSIQ